MNTTVLPEIEKLRDYLESGKKELEAEEAKIEEIVKQEAHSFFSRRFKGSRNPSLEEEFRESIKNIYFDKISKKRALLELISKKIERIESEYLTTWQ